MNNILEQLNAYFNSKTPEELKAEWAELDKYNKSGPTIEEFLKYGAFIYNLDEDGNMIADYPKSEWELLNLLPPIVKFMDDYYRLTVLREDNGYWTVTYHSDIAALRGDLIGFSVKPEEVFDNLVELYKKAIDYNSKYLK